MLSFCCWKIRTSILGSESTLDFGASSTLRKTLYFSGIFLLAKRLNFTTNIRYLHYNYLQKMQQRETLRGRQGRLHRCLAPLLQGGCAGC